jgi:hypothetical protein
MTLDLLVGAALIAQNPERDGIGIESPSRSIFLNKHDLRANAPRLSRGKPLRTLR